MHLVYEDADGRRAQTELGPSQSILLVGRHPDCQVRTAEPTVSRRHCEFTWSNGQVTVKDLGSTAGTFIGGRKVNRARVDPGDTVTAGTFEMVLDDGSAPATRRPEARTAAPRTPEPVATPEPEAVQSSGWAFIYDTPDGEQRRAFEYGDAPITVGRRKDCAIVAASPTVGRHHARFSWEGGEVVLADLDSSNGTFVNDRRVRKAVLTAGDLVRCGGFELRVICAQSQSQMSEAEWESRYGDDGFDDEDMAPPSWHLLYRGEDGRLTVTTMGPSYRDAAIGSDSGCEITAEARDLEPDHATIQWDEGTLILSDLDTSAGTSVNGKEVAERLMRNEDEIYCGEFRLRALRASTGSVRASSSRSAAATEWAPVLRRRDPGICLTYTVSDDARTEFTLWGDGEARLERIADGERSGTEISIDDPLIEALFDALLRAGFPDTPTEERDEDEVPPEIAVFIDQYEGGVFVTRRVEDRVPAFKEALGLIRVILSEMEPE